MESIIRAQHHARHLQSVFSWTKAPLIVGAPMRILSGPKLAVKISEAGGLGFIGPGAEPEHLEGSLREVKELLKASPLPKGKPLPIGVGIQTWAGDLKVAVEALRQTHVSAIWLFAPRHGQAELDEWTKAIREASPVSQIWIQVASVKDAVAAATSQHRPDVLVIQGSDAGGHSLKKGAGIVTLLPEVADGILESAGEKLADHIPLIAAGGISESRGAAAAMALGASGVTIGTRLLATHEANIASGYRDHIIAASDGGQKTVRTQLYNHLRGTTDWPEDFDARGLSNASWRDHERGMDFAKNRELHDEAMKKGNDSWGEEHGRTATYAGTGVGLIKDVENAGTVVENMRNGIGEIRSRAYAFRE